jgi:hypothetical protein
MSNVEESMWDLLKARTDVFVEIHAERRRQDAEHGVNDHADGTGPEVVWSFTGPAAFVAENARKQLEHEVEESATTWRSILLEEVAEAFAEMGPAALRGELIHVAAVAVAWIEAIDRRVTS